MRSKTKGPNIHSPPAAARAVDVAIIGSGFAGLAAGIESVSSGASTLIIEKRNSFGGNSIIADGSLAAAGTSAQAARGIDDSPEQMGADMLRAGLGRNDPAWVQRVASRSADTLRWVEQLGCSFEETIYQLNGHTRPRCVNPRGGGRALIRVMLAAYRQRGGQALRRTKFTDFLLGDDGALLGVQTRGVGGAHAEEGYIQVRRAVVLASGGFAGDVAFRLLHDERLDASISTTNLPDTSAEVLSLAMDLGAQARDLEWIQLAPWTSPDERGYGVAPLFISYAVFPFGMVVDASTGERFMNELADRRVQTEAMLALGQPCVGIADLRSATRSGCSLERGLRNGSIERFSSLPELSSRYQIPGEALHASVERFNQHITRRQDPDFHKPIRRDCEPLRPPFLGARLWPKAHYTIGGLRIDRDTRVIGRGSQNFPWLFAAGEITGGVHGACRLGAIATTECLVQGRIAGQRAAALGGPDRPQTPLSTSVVN